MKKINLISADFETTSNQINPEVYSWGMMFEDNNFKYGISIESFLEEIKLLDKDYIMYFHNGAKFDSHFIIPKLTENGFIYKLLPYPNNPSNNKSFIERSPYREEIEEEEEFSKFLAPYEFSLLVDANHKVMEMKIGLPGTKGKKKHNRVLIIRDSNLLFVGSIKSYGNTLNKAFSTTLYSKLDIGTNYDRTTLYNSLNEFENDGNELEYLKQDTFILIEYLKYIDTTFSRKYWKMTAASTAYSVWKYKFFGQQVLESYLANGKVIEKKMTNGMSIFKFAKGKKWYSSKKVKDLIVQKIFPTKELPKELFNWFGGGLTGANPIYRGIMMEGISSVDYNSHYPSQMINRMLPYGILMKNDKGSFKYYKIITTKECTNKKGLPFSQVMNKSGRMPYAPTIPKGYLIYFTTPEYEEFKTYYEGEWKEQVIYSQDTIEGKKIFGPYVEFFYEQKRVARIEKNEAEAVIAKLMLNALFGKFGTKNERMSRIWNDNSKTWEREISTEDLQYYLPLAIAITAYARMKLVQDTGFNFDKVLGYDTDSIYFRQEFINDFNFDIDELKIGALKVEHTNMKGFFRRSKQYIFKDNGEFKIAFAGINFDRDKEAVSFENFISGAMVENQLRPNKLPTGVYLEEFEKEIKAIWDEEYIKNDEGLNLWYKDMDSYFKNYKQQEKILKEIR